jgi:hypothetical protein
MFCLRPILRHLRIVMSLALAAGFGASGSAFAAAQASRTGYFQTLDGSIGFVFDRSGEMPKQRFDGSPEILLLAPAPAARGDTVFRQEDGLIGLRETPFGALTFFSRRYRNGVPIVRLGDAAPLIPDRLAPDDVLARAVALADHLKIALGRPVTIEIPAIAPMSPPALGVLAQALENTGIAFDSVLSAAASKKELAALVRTVCYQIRNEPGLGTTRVTLKIDFAPHLGVAGRPSSLQLETYLNAMVRSASAPQPATDLPPTSFDRSR